MNDHHAHINRSNEWVSAHDARAAYLLRFDALRRYFEVVVARIGVVAVLDGASVEQLAHLLLRLEYDVNVAFRLGRLILFARPFNSAETKMGSEHKR